MFNLSPLAASIELVCDDPIIFSVYSRDGRYLATIDFSETLLSDAELKALRKEIQEFPSYIGPDSLRSWNEIL